MWIAKFRVLDKENGLTDLFKKYKIGGNYYPLGNYLKNNRYHFIATGTIKGDNKKIGGFFKKLKLLKKERKVESLEFEENFFVIITSHTISEERRKFVRIFYNPQIIYLRPVGISSDGFEDWEIASLDKEVINDLIKVGQKIYNLELKALYWKKIRNIGFLTVLPELTEKQKKALEFCLENGYYEYPRRINLDELAKKQGLAFSTFQAHVRKAENKIINFVINANKS